jgi:hypothetical protein
MTGLFFGGVKVPRIDLLAHPEGGIFKQNKETVCRGRLCSAFDEIIVIIAKLEF